METAVLVRAGGALLRPAPGERWPRRVVEPIEGAVLRNEDWYGEELPGSQYTRCDFRDVDLAESTARGRAFDECAFADVRFNISRHIDSAFTNCTFSHCNLFNAEFNGCKLTGSTFRNGALRPSLVRGGDWSFVGLPGADLRRSTFHDVRMRESDLIGAEFADAILTDSVPDGSAAAKHQAHPLRPARQRPQHARSARRRARRDDIGPEQAVMIAHALGLRGR